MLCLGHMPVNGVELFIASPIGPFERVVARASDLFSNPQVDSFPKFKQISAYSDRGHLGGTVRVSPDEVVADSQAIMAALDSQRLVAPVIGSWITASPTSLGRFLRIETTDGAYISGMVVRDKSGPDFYAYQSRGKEGTESAQRIALMMVKKLGYAPLTLAFATPNGEVEVNWDGKVAVTSNTSDALDIADAMGRYQTVRDRFVFRWRPVGPTTLQEAGFGADLVNLYLGGNWSHPGINQRLHLETSLQGDALEG